MTDAELDRVVLTFLSVFGFITLAIMVLLLIESRKK